MELTLRLLSEADAAAASAVARRSFAAFVAPDWEPRAIEHFYAHSAPEVLVEMLQSCACLAGAFSGDRMVGFILMPQPSFVRMLFVEPSAMRRGAGRRLWEFARAHIGRCFPKVATVELSSSPHAVAFYRRIGFAPLSAPFVRDGCRATRMACWLPARALDAAL